jgi:hypothetical protein
MTIANGRGDENKVHILSQYGLHPLMHSVLLNGHSITCCCGQLVKDRFYQFDVVVPSSGRVVNTLYAGEDCAERFLSLSRTSGLSRITPLALFDPLQSTAGAGPDVRDAGLAEDDAPMAPINTEVEHAIYLALICCATPVSESVLSDFLRKIRSHPDRPLADWEVRAVNTAIGNGGHTLATILVKLREENKSLKHFAFPEMAAALRREAARTGLRIHSCL